MEEFDESIFTGHVADALSFVSVEDIEGGRDTKAEPRPMLARLFSSAQQRLSSACGLDVLESLERQALQEIAPTNARPCIVDESRAATKSDVSRGSEASTTTPAEQAFEIVKEEQVDQDTGEPVEGKDVVRGSRRVQTIHFRANHDLIDLSRTATIKIGFIRGNTTVKLGTFLKRDEPYVFSFPEESVPRRVPAIEFDCTIAFSASNLAAPVFEESYLLKMV